MGGSIVLDCKGKARNRGQERSWTDWGTSRQRGLKEIRAQTPALIKDRGTNPLSYTERD